MKQWIQDPVGRLLGAACNMYRNRFYLTMQTVHFLSRNSSRLSIPLQLTLGIVVSLPDVFCSDLGSCLLYSFIVLLWKKHDPDNENRTTTRVYVKATYLHQRPACKYCHRPATLLTVHTAANARPLQTAKSKIARPSDTCRRARRNPWPNSWGEIPSLQHNTTRREKQHPTTQPTTPW